MRTLALTLLAACSSSQRTSIVDAGSDARQIADAMPAPEPIEDAGADARDAVAPHGTHYGNACPINTGLTDCNASMLVCCFDQKYACVTPKTCAGVPLPCIGRAGCGAGEVCCADAKTAPTQTQCMIGACPLHTICTGDDDCPEGQTCSRIWFQPQFESQGFPVYECHAPG